MFTRPPQERPPSDRNAEPHDHPAGQAEPERPSRRDFIRTGAVGLAGASIAPQLAGVQSATPADTQGLIGDGQGPCITQERLGFAAIDIARHLVDENEKGERTRRCRPPILECAQLGCMDSSTEAVADLPVKDPVLLEPERFCAGRKPEIVDGAGVGHAATGPTSLSSAMRAIAGRARTFSARRRTPGKRL